MKKILIASLALLFAFTGVLYAVGVNGDYKGKPIVKVQYNGEEVPIDKVPGYIENGNTMVPLGLLRKMGFAVDWNAKTYTANVKVEPQVKVIRATLKQEKLDEISKSVGKVLAADEKGQVIAQGSGFMIEGDILVTNAHVVEGSALIGVEINGKKLVSREQVFYNRTTDVAGYRLKDAAPALKLNPKIPSKYDVVYTIGYPAGEFKLDAGYVLSTWDFDNQQLIAITANTNKGTSGGAMINDNGEVVGIVTHSLDGISIQLVFDELK